MNVEKLQDSCGTPSKRHEKRKAALESDVKIALVKLPEFKFVIQEKGDVKAQNKKLNASVTTKATDKATTSCVSRERMRRFLMMTRADLPRRTPKIYACEKDIKLLKAPKDTIRCTACRVLYEPAKRYEHLKNCKKTISEQHMYACVSCNFKHADMKEIEVHVKTAHKKKAEPAAIIIDT